MNNLNLKKEKQATRVFKMCNKDEEMWGGPRRASNLTDFYLQFTQQQCCRKAANTGNCSGGRHLNGATDAAKAPRINRQGKVEIFSGWSYVYWTVNKGGKGKLA